MTRTAGRVLSRVTGALSQAAVTRKTKAEATTEEVLGGGRARNHMETVADKEQRNQRTRAAGNVTPGMEELIDVTSEAEHWKIIDVIFTGTWNSENGTSF